MPKRFRKLQTCILKHVSGLPLWKNLEVEIQSACNRDCVFCPRYGDRSGIRKDGEGKPVIVQMPSENVYRIIDQAAQLHFTGKIKLHRLSEPFIDSRYVEFAHYIKRQGLHLFENTNGDVLRNNDALCDQLDGLIEHLTIGLYDDYQHDREKQEDMAYWRSKFQKTTIAFSLPQENCIIRQGSHVYGRVNKSEDALQLPCNQPSRMFLIRYDGHVQLCCEDDCCAFNLGNAFDQKLQDIWWSYRHITITRQLQQTGGRLKFDRCQRCYNSQPPINLL